MLWKFHHLFWYFWMCVLNVRWNAMRNRVIIWRQVVEMYHRDNNVIFPTILNTPIERGAIFILSQTVTKLKFPALNFTLWGPEEHHRFKVNIDSNIWFCRPQLTFLFFRWYHLCFTIRLVFGHFLTEYYNWSSVLYLKVHWTVIYCYVNYWRLCDLIYVFTCSKFYQLYFT